MSNSSSLVRYLGSRLLLAPVMLWLIASLVFLLLRVAPGDPVDALLGNRQLRGEKERDGRHANKPLGQPG